MRALQVLRIPCWCFLVVLCGAHGVAQQCPGAGRITGVVIDPSSAVVRDGRVTLTDGQGGQETARSNDRGAWSFTCLRDGSYRGMAATEGFEGKERVLVLDPAHRVVTVQLRLEVATVKQSIAVGAVDARDRGAGENILQQDQLQKLADDPDDFERQLQALASAAGGIAGKATITVDGFQNASRLPPKSSLQEVRINPDMFSAEYESPPYAGGRIEAYTKPGQDRYHGAVFGAYGDAAWNARDPLAASSTPASKRRLGFELSGPLLASLLSKKRADFALDFETRRIDENAVVDATTLAVNGAAAPLHQSVGQPQTLWIGNARTGWQLSQKDSLVASFAANRTDVDNKGVGGLVLTEAGYASRIAEYDLRFANTLVLSPRLLDTARFGVSWKSTAEDPSSTAPQIAVAGSFTGGGSTAGAMRANERDLEIDDELLFSPRRHTLKAGVQLLGASIHDRTPDSFNGAYVFGGGEAPALDASGAPAGGLTVINGLEQYRRALNGLPGGAPTTYSVTTGNADVPLQQWTTALYVQDQWQIGERLSIATGLRYFGQTAPDIGGTFAPRLGLAITPDRKKAWTLHARAGLFYSPVATGSALETVRLDGERQRSTTVYSPSFDDPLGSAAASPQIGEVRTFRQHLALSPSFQSQASVEHTFLKSWALSTNVYYTAHWDVLRSRNVNAPFAEQNLENPVAAPRPLSGSVNTFQYQSTGRLAGPLAFVGLNRFGQRFSLISGYLYNGLHGDADTADSFPQSAYTDRGDDARPAWRVSHSLFAVMLVQLPWKIASSTDLSVARGMPYDVTTGLDNNGDGVFNDRPSRVVAEGPGVYGTRFGLLNTTAVNGNLVRDAGTMPATVHLDLTLSREFKLRERPAKEGGEWALRLDAQSSNLLNHANDLSVDGVVGTSLFGQPLTADYGRRLELGARLSF